MDYCRKDLAYKCGNINNCPSEYNFIKRWRLEKQLDYNNLKYPIFLYAYRAFIDALAANDKQVLEKMCERNLYKKL